MTGSCNTLLLFTRSLELSEKQTHHAPKRWPLMKTTLEIAPQTWCALRCNGSYISRWREKLNWLNATWGYSQIINYCIPGVSKIKAIFLSPELDIIVVLCWSCPAQGHRSPVVLSVRVEGCGSLHICARIANRHRHVVHFFEETHHRTLRIDGADSKAGQPVLAPG